MERLTNEDHSKIGFVSYNGARNPYKLPLTIGELAGFLNADYSPREVLEDVFNRLAAYEDTGLEPEEIAVLQRIEAGEYIARDEAVALIEEKQKALCPVGRFSRHAVYGTDRETFDAWQEIIDAIENIQSAEVEPFPNIPLTMKELLEMGEEPVWVALNGLGHWDILSGAHTDNAICFLRTVLPTERYGDGWMAYRRKPEEVGKDA